jgi:GNAT superfamily N-acetyltransferase
VQQAIPSLVIRRVDPHDDDEMRTFQRVYEEAERAEIPDAPVLTQQDTVTFLGRPSLAFAFEGYAAFDGDRMVGEAVIMASLVDNLESARLWAWVPPAERGRGVGSALVDFAVARCAEMGRGILHSSARYPAEARDTHPYRRFAERHGFAVANTEIERRLALPVPATRLGGLEMEVRRHAAGYSIRAIVGPIPGEFLAGYAEVSNRLRLDAHPGDLLVEADRRTPEIVADQDAELQEQGRTRVTTLALDPEGTVVAFSCAVVPPESPQVEQWGTIVRPDHRGHRLGLAVKVALIRALEDAFPERRFITTTNAETNSPMVSINELLGFERFAMSVDFQRVLAGFPEQPGDGAAPAG